LSNTAADPKPVPGPVSQPAVKAKPKGNAKTKDAQSQSQDESMPSDTEERIQKPKPSVPHLAPSMDVDDEDLNSNDAEGMALLPPA
jgi:hypothetical protein